MPPTSIDGTDITGATIDGQDVQEITVDGQTVFSAQTLPVAYSNLVAWYPFDSAEYGGSNADDVTALFNSGQSGDSIAYDGTVGSGVSYVSSGGVNDINAGANSGAFDFSDDFINIGSSVFDSTSAFTITCWFDDDGNTDFLWSNNDNDDGARCLINANGNLNFTLENNGTRNVSDVSMPGAGYNFAGFVSDGSGNTEIYINNGSSPVATSSGPTSGGNPVDFRIGGHGAAGNEYSGLIDDYRIYDTNLSGIQIDQIYQNTEP